jgi:hypothetical protein
MLQGVEAEIGLARGVGMAVDGDDAAFFAEFVVFANLEGQGQGQGQKRRDSNRRSGRLRFRCRSATPSTP